MTLYLRRLIKLRKYRDNKSDLVNALQEIADAAYLGLENSKSIKASIGRAKTYGDKSLGYPDPGATTTYMILKSMSDYVKDLSTHSS